MGSNYGNRYDASFKREAVSLVIDGNEPYARVAVRLGIGRETLRRWVQSAQVEVHDDAEVDQTQRLRNLERENAQLRMERDILKEAVGIFSQRPK